MEVLLSDEKSTMRFQYRIMTRRFDVPPSVYDIFSTEGVDAADCDRQAMERFDKAVARPDNEWNGMDLIRIDAPAVAERTTLVKKNGKQEHDDC